MLHVGHQCTGGGPSVRESVEHQKSKMRRRPGPGGQREVFGYFRSHRVWWPRKVQRRCGQMTQVSRADPIDWAVSCSRGSCGFAVAAAIWLRPSAALRSFSVFPHGMWDGRVIALVGMNGIGDESTNQYGGRRRVAAPFVGLAGVRYGQGGPVA